MKAFRITAMLTLCVASFAVPTTAQANHSSVPDVSVEESESVAIFWVHSDCGPRGTYRTEDGTAKADQDYEAQTGQLTRPGEGVRPGSSSFQIPLIDDNIRETDETVRVIVTLAPENVMFGVGTAGCSDSNYNEVQTIEATLTILDDDGPTSSEIPGSGSSTTSNRSISSSRNIGSKTQGSTTPEMNQRRRNTPAEELGPGLGSDPAESGVREEAAGPLVRVVQGRGRAPSLLAFIGLGSLLIAATTLLWLRKNKVGASRS